MTAQIIFIVWRESVEALLVIGILHSWLGRNAAGTGAARYLWGGVAAGIALALALGLVILNLSEWLHPAAQDYMMAGMVILAAILIVQMVLWMRAHGKRLKRDLEMGLTSAMDQRQWWAVFTLSLLAVAREGSETVIFLFGVLGSATSSSAAGSFLAIVLGFAAALGTYGLLQLGGRVLSWRLFFRVTETMLLLLGCALVVTAAGQLIGLGVLPFTATVWDSSWLLDDGSTIGGLIASLTGYRSAPDEITVAVWIGYFALIYAAMRLQDWRSAAQSSPRQIG